MTTATAPPSATRTIAGLALWLGITALAAAAGGLASARAPLFYAQLARPDWAPPSWLFGPVWTVLYILMAVGAFLVWRERGWAGARTALGLYLAQLALNAAWTWIFFGLHNGLLALAEIVLLLGFVVATIAAFRRIRPLAAALLLPYLAWSGFATLLTWTLWRMNPGVL